MSTLVDAGKVTDGVIATLRATIAQPPLYVLVGDHERPEPDDDADQALYLGKPRLEVYRIPMGPPRSVGGDTGGFAGQTGAMEWIRHELRMGEGLTRQHVDHALDRAVAVLTERDTDGSWMYEIDLDGGQVVIDRQPGGRGRIDPPHKVDTFAATAFVDVWVHADGS